MSISLPSTVINEFNGKVTSVLTSGDLAEGSIRKSIEAKYTTETSWAKLINSCGSGMFSALTYLKDKESRNIAIVQDNTFYGVKTVASLAEYECYFAECKFNGLTMDEASLLQVINENSLDTSKVVVIYSHIGGSNDHSFDYVLNVCASLGIPVIEDAAHSFGINDGPVRSFARVYSFYATKTASAGEGGLVVTSSKEFDSWLYDFMMYDRLKMKLNKGLNLRVSEVQALLIECVINNIREIIDSRMSTLNIYRSYCDLLGIKYFDADYSNHNAYKFIVVDDRVVKCLDSKLQTGAVFNYSMSGRDVSLPHICLDTNYSVTMEKISKTLDGLKACVS